MECDISEFFDLYVLPPGRRVHAVTEMSKRAAEFGIDQAVELARRCLQHDAHLLVMEQQRRGSTRALYSPAAHQYNALLDRSVRGLYTHLDNQVQIFTEDSERGRAAAFAKDALFPTGANPIVTPSFVEQHAEVKTLLLRAESPEIAAALAKLPDAQAILDRMRELNVKYGRSLDDRPRMPTSEDIRAARAQGHALMLDTVVLILAHFITRAPEDGDGRAYVLEPLLRQNELVRQARRRRRKPDDVDVIDTPAADADEPAASEPLGDNVDATTSGEFPTA